MAVPPSRGFLGFGTQRRSGWFTVSRSVDRSGEAHAQRRVDLGQVHGGAVGTVTSLARSCRPGGRSAPTADGGSADGAPARPSS